MMYLEFMKSFFSPIRANWWMLESFRDTEPKNDWFPLSRDDVPRVHEKFFLADSSELMGVRVISAYWAQNVWFPLSRHDVRRVHKKFFSRWFARTDGCKRNFGPVSPKTFDSHFLDMMYVEFIKNFFSLIKTFFFSLIRANWWTLESFRPPERELMDVRVISAYWAQKRLIPSC